MASLKQKRVSDISFTIDSSLNILDASRGFLRFFNISDKNTNLRFFLDRESITEMLYFVNGYDGSKNIFVSRLYAREEKLDCLFIVKNCQDGEFEMDLIVVDYLYELYNNSTQLNEEYKAFMSNQYSFYFVYDLDSNNVILKNTKYLAVIFEGDYLSFKDSFIKYFNIDTNIDLTAQAFDKLESDVENSY